MRIGHPVTGLHEAAVAIRLRALFAVQTPIGARRCYRQIDGRVGTINVYGPGFAGVPVAIWTWWDHFLGGSSARIMPRLAACNLTI